MQAPKAGQVSGAGGVPTCAEEGGGAGAGARREALRRRFTFSAL